MGRQKGNKNKKKNNSKANKRNEHSYPAVVGPDLFLLLQGRLFDDCVHDSDNGKTRNESGKNVSLILCGESHNDAIDVTRRSPPGKFDPTEGWIPVADSLSSNDNNNITDDTGIHTALPDVVFVSKQDHDNQLQQTRAAAAAAAVAATMPTRPSLENLAIRFLYPVKGIKNRPVTLAKAQEIAKNFVDKYEIEEEMFGKNLLLLWIATASSGARAEKGQAFLLEIEIDQVIEYNNNADSFNNNDNNSDDEDDDDDDDDDEESFDDWVFFSVNAMHEESSTQQRNRFALPHPVAQWMDDVMMVPNRELNLFEDDNTAATIDAIEDASEGSDDETADTRGDADEIGETGASEYSSTIQRNTCRYALFEYGDLDSQAHELSKRRLGMTDTEITESEYDHVVETRKHLLREKHNVCTFDDWFDHVRSATTEAGVVVEENGDGQLPNSKDKHAVHLVLEASVPPWEVEIHRPSINNCCGISDSDKQKAAEDFRLHPASECIRCLPEDSEASSEDEFDPSNDGIGSYIDFVYRRMMEATTATRQKRMSSGVQPENKEAKSNCWGKDHINNNNLSDNGTVECDDHLTNSDWLHCIDARDLGCEAACHAESLKNQWYELLSQEEQKLLSDPVDVVKDSCPIDEEGSVMRFLPAYKLNPEWIELERLRTEGILLQDAHDGSEDTHSNGLDNHGNSLEFTFPSFELFFGNNTDNIYYTPHVKMAYSPFLAHCVQSLENWEVFFTNLFLGGTIQEAIDRLNLRGSKSRGHVHVRSPILQQWDPESNSYVWKQRNEEDYVTCPFFPFAFHLIAKGSSPHRTWSSQLFDNLHNFQDRDGRHQISRQKVAILIRSWVLDSVRRHMNDPKSSDDHELGGEWFAAFLRSVHREIYDDIDISDPAILLQKNYVKSLSGKKFAKHNIGKIKIPCAKDAFDEIISRFREEENLPPTVNVVTPRVEVLGKILIDIWMSNLFDFSLLLKIVDTVSKDSKDNVVIVCYVGSAHAKVVRDFFCGPLGFKKKATVGKFTWEDHEAKILNLPSKLWNLSELFQ